MRKITYSQDTVIKDSNLLAALAVFAETTYLPYPSVLLDLHTATTEAAPTLAEPIQATIDTDQEHQRIQAWAQEHRILFDEGALEFLPVHRFKVHKHRHLDDTDEKMEEVYGDMASRGTAARLVLQHHLIRDDLPGIELFDSGKTGGQVKLASEIFHLELPKVSGSTEKICELRAFAQKQDVVQFWEMVEYHTKLADVSNEEYITRGAKIREDFDKWLSENMKFRGKSLAVAGLISLCFLNSSFTPLAGLATAAWLGEVNKWWVERKRSQDVSYRFISKVNGKVEKLHKK